MRQMTKDKNTETSSDAVCSVLTQVRLHFKANHICVHKHSYVNMGTCTKGNTKQSIVASTWCSQPYYHWFSKCRLLSLTRFLIILPVSYSRASDWFTFILCTYFGCISVEFCELFKISWRNYFDFFHTRSDSNKGISLFHKLHFITTSVNRHGQRWPSEADYEAGMFELDRFLVLSSFVTRTWAERRRENEESEKT